MIVNPVIFIIAPLAITQRAQNTAKQRLSGASVEAGCEVTHIETSLIHEGKYFLQI